MIQVRVLKGFGDGRFKKKTTKKYKNIKKQRSVEKGREKGNDDLAVFGVGRISVSIWLQPKVHAPY